MILNEFNDLIKDNNVLMVDFYSKSCKPCKMLAPLLDKVSDKIRVVKVDIEDSDELVRQYGINAVPTLLFFKNNVVVNKIIGLVSETTLVNAVKAII